MTRAQTHNDPPKPSHSSDAKHHTALDQHTAQNALTCGSSGTALSMVAMLHGDSNPAYANSCTVYQKPETSRFGNSSKIMWMKNHPNIVDARTTTTLGSTAVESFLLYGDLLVCHTLSVAYPSQILLQFKPYQKFLVKHSNNDSVTEKLILKGAGRVITVVCRTKLHYNPQ